MKKAIYLLLIILLPSCTTVKPTLFYYKDFPAEKEISVDKSKNDLFIGANSWFVESFNDPTNIIQFSDKEAGVIKGKYLIQGTYYAGSAYNSESDSRIFAVITILVKDNLTKIIILPQGVGKYYAPDPDTNEAYATYGRSSITGEEIKKKANELIADYETYILKYKNW
jgi:hypothetical protein